MVGRYPGVMARIQVRCGRNCIMERRRHWKTQS
jgi:ribosomal protein L34